MWLDFGPTTHVYKEHQDYVTDDVDNEEDEVPAKKSSKKAVAKDED